MRILSIAAASLLGSALSLATAQQLQTSGTSNTVPGNKKNAAPSQFDEGRKHDRSGAQFHNAKKVTPLDGRQLTSTQAPPLREKGYSGPAGDNFVSGGSDSCGTATNISGAGPFNGDNNGATTDGPASCISGASDVWYNWTAGPGGSVTVALCGSGFDCVLLVYNGNTCLGTELACNDDFCGLQSQASFTATPGGVYKIRIGGFGGAMGSYTMAITEGGGGGGCPCAGNPPEGEPGCGIPTDTFNGGCNSSPVVTSPITVGGTVCGIGAFDGSFRDTDWYEFTLAVPTTVTWTVTAEYPHAAAILDNSCPTPTVFTFVTAGACQTIATSAALPAGTFRVFAAADFVQIVPCAGPGNTYAGALTEGGGGGCANDDCSTPSAIAGSGPHAFDNCCATTGAQGQNEGLCLAFSTTGIGNDLWYTWGPAPSAGATTVSLCGQTGLDTKLAVYNGSGCPGGSAIACNDDFCGLQSELSFNATAGNFYTFQLGNFPGASCGQGTFTVTSPAGGNECENYDDGSSEDSVGFNVATGTDILWLHKQGTVAGSGTVVSISTAWGNPGFPGSAPPNGTPARVGIWDDPNDDGIPNDLVLLQEVATVTAGVETDVFQVVPITPQPTTGIYFIGASTSGRFPAPLDTTSAPSAGRAWICGDGGGTIDYTNLSGEPFPPTDEDAIAPGVWLLRGDCGSVGGCSGDECATPVAINGSGPHAFDNCCATTGSEGQNEGLCFFFSTTGIDNDLWYTWGPAASSGATQVSLCGQTGIDTKLAVYDGVGCPAAAAIACNDDACGLQSQLSFFATAGNFYTFQLGNFPGAACGQGTFTVTTLTPPGDCDVLDDGTTEDAIGFGAASGTDILWLHAQGAPGGSTVVKSISTAWGTPVAAGSAPPNGNVGRVGIWDDPNDDGNPNDLVLLQEVSTVIANSATDIKQLVMLSPSVQTNGIYFIGASANTGAFPAPLDTSVASSGRAYICGDNAGNIDYTNLSAEPFPPTDEDTILPGVFLLEGGCKDISITPMCFGDGTSAPCPCLGVGGSTNGAPGNGCGNSVNPLGANLAGSGNAIDSADTLTLNASGMRPGTLCLVIQGDAEVNKLIYGDGLRCFGGRALRLYTFTPHNGSVTAPSAAAIPPNTTISDRAAQLGFPIVNGTYIYQVWYRDPARPFACDEFQPVGATFNVTNGLRVQWSL